MKVIDVFKGYNPWSKINLNKGDFFIKKDWESLSSQKRKMLKKYSSLPEPFSGNPNSCVVCLNANPGEKDDCYENSFGMKKFIKLTKQTLRGNAKQSLWYDMKDHSGYCWLQYLTKELRKDLKRNPQLFMIDYFPYHSSKSFTFPNSLPSYDFTNKLVEAAIDEGKIIIILRKETEWKNRIAKLNNYSKCFVIHSKRNICLSRKNLGDKVYNIVLSSL